jgi:hypothetical protein
MSQELIDFHVHSQSATIKQGREKEKLKMTHDKQLESLSHDLQKVKMDANGSFSIPQTTQNLFVFHLFTAH